MDSRRRYLGAALLIALAAALGMLASAFIVPSLIRSAYRQESWPFLNNLFVSGLSVHPVEHYLDLWHKLVWAISPAVILFGLILFCSPNRKAVGLVLVLLLAVSVRLPGLFSRAMWVDESYTLLETAGHAPPIWPTEPSPAGTVQYQYQGAPSLGKIREILLEIDVHPPVYSWAVSLWRRLFGFSLEMARAFSLICSGLTIVALYLLLRAGQVERPLVPTLVYAVSASAVYWGSEARDYAMAALFVTLGALFAYLAARAAPRNRRKAAIYSIAMAVSCGAAFQTQYLAFFSIAVVMAWFTIVVWRKSPPLAVIGPAITLLLAIADLPLLRKQVAARPTQGAGFGSLWGQLNGLFRVNLEQIWQPTLGTRALDYLVIGGLVVLLGITLWLIFSRWQETNQGFWILLLGLAGAPTVGLLLMGLLFDKRLFAPQYIAWSTPFFAALIAYPLARLYSSKRLLGSLLLTFVFLLQMDSINFGSEIRSPNAPADEKFRSIASAINQSWSPSQIVFIDEGCSDIGAGCGFQSSGALIYELAPRINIAAFGDHSDVERLLSISQSYKDIWIAFAVVGAAPNGDPGSVLDSPDNDVRKKLLLGLQAAGHHMELLPQMQRFFYRSEATP